MRKLSYLLVAMSMVISFGAVSFASGDHAGGHAIVGEVTKAEGAFVTVKDDHGKSHKFHVNGSTHMDGKVKTGVKVEVESTDSGHAISMKVVK